MESSLEQDRVLLICAKPMRVRLGGASGAADLAHAAELSACVLVEMLLFRIGRPACTGGESPGQRGIGDEDSEV